MQPPKDNDLKDKYDDVDEVNDIFTRDYYEYESGQKMILVKDRLKERICFWQRIGANNFVLDIIEQGYKIPFYSIPERSCLENNVSAINESAFVTEVIEDLLIRKLIVKCDYQPNVVNPLTVSVQSNGKKRLILDLRVVNKHVWKQSVRYDDIEIVLEYFQPECHMFKFDIHSAYHFVDIFYVHTDYLGFHIRDNLEM